MICQKAGKPGGFLVWVPLLQIIPLLRAAGMSSWWFLGWLLPPISIIAQVIWCFKIAQARAKSAFVGFMLLLPVTNLLAILYLAFSEGASEKPKAAPKKIQLMTLETC
jgi:hypothetical protein